jgi:hypothetical protein
VRKRERAVNPFNKQRPAKQRSEVRSRRAAKAQTEMGVVGFWSKFVAVSRSFSQLDDLLGQRADDRGRHGRHETRGRGDPGRATDEPCPPLSGSLGGKRFFPCSDCFGLAWFVALSTFIYLYLPLFGLIWFPSAKMTLLRQKHSGGRE